MNFGTQLGQVIRKILAIGPSQINPVVSMEAFFQNGYHLIFNIQHLLDDLLVNML